MPWHFSGAWPQLAVYVLLNPSVRPSLSKTCFFLKSGLFRVVSTQLGETLDTYPVYRRATEGNCLLSHATTKQ